MYAQRKIFCKYVWLVFVVPFVLLDISNYLMFDVISSAKYHLMSHGLQTFLFVLFFVLVMAASILLVTFGLELISLWRSAVKDLGSYKEDVAEYYSAVKESIALLPWNDKSLVLLLRSILNALNAGMPMEEVNKFLDEELKSNLTVDEGLVFKYQTSINGTSVPPYGMLKLNLHAGLQVDEIASVDLF